jgi:GT2 family glycosyltransferase
MDIERLHYLCTPDLDPLFWRGGRTGVVSAWYGHVPFAHWIVAAVKPRTIVELGTHNGVSYSAFCEAVLCNGLDTRCFAVDTWEGDEQAGYYGEEVYRDLRRFHDERYSAFSELLRCTFDDALPHIPDGSVDLLHFDGLHTYEAVRHDFESWRRKLSDSAAILFHDTNVRQGDFGVWRLWEELCIQYPSFEFLHGHGLGLLAIGCSVPTQLSALCSLSDPQKVHTIRQRFSLLGERWMRLDPREQPHAEEQWKRLEGEIRERDARISSLEAEAARRSAMEADLRARARHRTAQARAEAANAVRQVAGDGAQATIASAANWLLEAKKGTMRSLLSTRLNLFLNSGAKLRLPASSQPDISIILILCNQAELTFGCLSSIQECLKGTSLGIEVIILDNRSTDETSCLLAQLVGANIVRSPENLHFLRGVNRAAKEATGRHLLLLNNDAQLLPGAVESSLRTLEAEPDIGAVGGRIILPDGTLQEAGSIVWSNGACVGYGRGRSPGEPEFMFKRDVDYCSGAFLLTPRYLFDRLGGFDERYQPAYYEETDYCLRLWQSGFRVVFDPDVAILHYEFGSAEASVEALALQQRNFAIFQAHQAAWLQGQLPFAPENLVAGRRARSSAKRILMIEDRVPHSSLGAGYPRTNLLLRELVQAGAEVTFYPMHKHPESWPRIRQSVPSNVEVLLNDSRSDLRTFLAERSSYYDAILVCRPHNMQDFLTAVGENREIIGGAKIIYDAEAIFARREVLKRSYTGSPPSESEADALVANEIDLTRPADLVISVSRLEKGIFEKHGGGPVRVLGYAVEIDPTESPVEERPDILFVGAVSDEDSPNSDSLRWFATQILPILRRELGSEIRLKVVGRNGAPSIAALDGTAIDLVGPVDDLRPQFERARVMVIPTRFAAGISLKAVQAAGFGVPIVTTDLIAEQLGWKPGHDLLATSDANLFAKACASLFRDRDLWHRLRNGALERCREDYSVEQIRRKVKQIVEFIPTRSSTPPVAAPIQKDYADWIRRYDTLTGADKEAVAARIAAFAKKPLISVVVPVYNTPEHLLRRCIDSVIRQLYPHWELCIADDQSPLPHVAAVCKEYSELDTRIRFIRREVNGHIAAATNSALNLASGEFIALLDHDDELALHALYMVAEELNENTELDLIFSDEDKIDERGTRFDPWFKCDWNYDLMLSQNAIVHLAVYRHSILKEIGGFRSGFDGSQDYDLTLRFIERTTPERIRHIPFVLYHWRAIPGSVALTTEEKSYPYEAAARAIQEHLDRAQTGATVTQETHLGYYRVHWPLPTELPRVSIIIPTKDKIELLLIAVESIFAMTKYNNFEVVIVDNGSEKPESKSYLGEIASRSNVQVFYYDQPYSFAALNNWAVKKLAAPLIAFVNNDIEVIEAGWLSEMVSHALRPNVGIVGAKLYYPDETIQHAGIVVGIGKTAGHPHTRMARRDPGYFGRAVLTQQFSAVTGACLVMRRNVFESVGGFDEINFAIAFNDVDLGLRVRRAGYSVVWTPYAELFHHESASLGPSQSPERKALYDRECKNLRARWYEAIENDPFYNPNATITGGDFAPAFPPRVTKPWRQRPSQ